MYSLLVLCYSLFLHSFFLFPHIHCEDIAVCSFHTKIFPLFTILNLIYCFAISLVCLNVHGYFSNLQQSALT